MIKTLFLPLTTMALIMAVPAPVLAAEQPQPDRIELGRDENGDPCVAVRDWSRSEGKVKAESDQAFVLTCRGVSAARLQGISMPAQSAEKPSSERQCGAPGQLNIPGLAIASARRCYDPRLGLTVVELRTAGPRPFVGAAAPSALLPLAKLLRSQASGQPVGPEGADKTKIDISSLAAAPAASTAAMGNDNINAESALQLGIQLINSGQHAEASRLLNDALSRTDERTAQATVIDLMMTAALADSNLGQFEVAEGADSFGKAQSGFSAAALFLATGADIDNKAYLVDKLRTYRALDALNQRRWSEAIAILDAVRTDTSPLQDPVALSKLNRAAATRGQASLSLRDKGQYYWLILDIQQRYARSVALVAQQRFDAAKEALSGKDGAVERFRNLETLAQPGSINWLRSRIQLQYARIDARTGRNREALVGYDCAIQSMKGVIQPDSCPVPLKQLALTYAEGGISVANIQLERASVAQVANTGDASSVVAQYEDAIDTLIASGDASRGTQQPALTGYFRLLLKQEDRGASLDNEEKYFRAMQVVGDPAVASDMAQLANVVATDGTVGAKSRDRAELKRRINQLRYQFAGVADGDVAQRNELDKQRRTAEAELDVVNTALNGETRYLAQDDSPTSIAEIRAILHPDELYLRLVELRSVMFGIVIGANKVSIYELPAPTNVIAALSNTVLASARSQKKPDGTNSLKEFDVENSYRLFRAVTGPNSEMVARSKRLVYDAAGVLRTIPASIFVTDADSVRRFKANRKNDAFDYRDVAFLAKKTDLAMALSPRSFQLVRQKLTPSSAPQRFLGLGENASSPQVSAALARTPVLRGSGCTISYGDWARVKDGNPPISGVELKLAATALGAPDAPQITGEAFTDVAIQQASADGRLSQFQVLHFATHGLPETRISADGCAMDIQPSLITTMAAPLAEGRTVSEGLLTFSKVAGLNLNANLVVLAACDTAASGSWLSNLAAGAEGATGTLDGLIRAFISANARAVMATYWSVPDSQQTNELMEAFYRTGRTQSIGEALRAAQSSLLQQKDWSHPYYWGAYFVVGDTAKTMLTADVKSASASKGDGAEM